MEKWPSNLNYFAGRSRFSNLCVQVIIPTRHLDLKVMQSQLGDIVKLVRGQMTKLNRTTVGAMVTLDVHGRQIVEMLVAEKVNSPEAFSWLAQLRYYWQEIGGFTRKDTGKPNEKMECQVSIVNSTLLYGFEYLGNSARLVATLGEFR